MKDVIFEWWWAYGLSVVQEVNLEWVCWGLSVVFILCLFATAYMLIEMRKE